VLRPGTKSASLAKKPMKVDKFTAEQAVLEMQREMRLSDMQMVDEPPQSEAIDSRRSERHGND